MNGGCLAPRRADLLTNTQLSALRTNRQLCVPRYGTRFSAAVRASGTKSHSRPRRTADLRHWAMAAWHGNRLIQKRSILFVVEFVVFWDFGEKMVSVERSKTSLE